ncbi:hypothetical protein [Sphaerisporangium dianthi]|uniref:IrrE N-terminal-like domain-containing protein n=1 Tax=Sphaerisporangium dianthi TaxID=1436120 RepID=A0ABV9CPE1_9ACTN
MSLMRVRRRCDAIVDGLPLPAPFSARALCEVVSARRGRPIRLEAVPALGGGLGGLCVPTEKVDYIVYQEDTTPLHREHIILHELAHLLCGHEGSASMQEEMLGTLFPSLDPQKVREVLLRSRYSAVEEQEAEYIASLILHRVSSRASEPVRRLHPDDDSLVGRLERTLDRPPGDR